MNFLDKYSTLIIIVMLTAEAVLTALTIGRYITLKRKTIYSYENASLLGGSIFMVIMLIFSVCMLFTTHIGINPALAFISNISRISVYFPLLALPLMIVFLLFMSFSNISLIRHEGKSVRNIIGSVLSFVLIASTIAGSYGWDIIYQNIIFDIYTKGYQWITIFDVAIPQFLTSLLCYIECLLLGAMICAMKAAKHKPEYNKDYVIILGCAIAKDGTPLPLLRGRIDRAIAFSKEQYEKTGKKIKFVTSGGKGDDECISEAESMKGYLLSQGIAEEDIITENKSVNTLENMKFSKEKIDEDDNGGNIIYSTTNYHVFRSGIYARKAGLDAEGIAAPTKWYFWPNAFVREFAALLVSRKKVHIFNAIIFLIMSLFSGCAYLLLTK